MKQELVPKPGKTPNPPGPDPVIDGGLPWTRADEEQTLALADYWDEESKREPAR